MSNRFKNPQLRKIYDTMIELAADPSSELFNAHGLRRSGGSHRNAFWAGYDGITPTWVVPGTMGHACWRAGQDFRKMERPS